MIVPLVIVVTISLLASFLCSLMEAALFSLSIPYVRHLSDQGSKRGKILLSMKGDLGPPIATILIVNTVANTLGASIGGALVSSQGELYLLVFSIAFTILVLILSEIIPKKVGAVYSKEVSLLIVLPLQMLMQVLKPLVWVTQLLSRRIGSGNSSPSVSHHEVLSLAELGREEGVIDVLEDSVIRNVIGLDQVLVKDILTPRVVVFSLKSNTTILSLRESLFDLPHSRIPIFEIGNPNIAVGYVTQRDLARTILQCIAQGEGCESKLVLDVMRPLPTVPEVMRADKLMLRMVENKEAICSVVDEHGGFAGVVTLEDILEEIIGKEIVDEFDTVRDLRGYAKTLHELSGKGIDEGE